MNVQIWKRIALGMSAILAGCGPALRSHGPFDDLILAAQPVDPAILPSEIAEEGTLINAGNPLGASLTVGLAAAGGYSVATVGGTSPPATGDLYYWARRVKGIAAWTCDLIAFQPVRLDVHRSSDYPEEPVATPGAASTAEQDVERNEASAGGGAWVRIPLDAALGPVNLLGIATAAGAGLTLGSAGIPVGHYDQIRLWGADSRRAWENANNRFRATDTAGNAYEGVYKLPGQVLIINYDFEVVADRATYLTFGFDPEEALKIAGRRVILRPTSVQVTATYGTTTTGNTTATASPST